MIQAIAANAGRFALLMLVQVLVLDRIDLAHGWAAPYLYVLFLLMLPFELPGWAGLLIGAATGLVMDVFSSTPGMHMSACVLLMYVRRYLVRLMAPRGGYEFGMRPALASMGLAWTATNAAVLIAVHHLWLFFVDLHRFDAFLGTLARALLSALLTLGLCLLAQLLTTRTAERRRA